MLFFKKSSPIVASLLAAASSRMFRSRNIELFPCVEIWRGNIPTWKAGFFTLKNLAVDTGHLTPRVIFNAESEYAILILIVLRCQFLEGGWKVPSYNGITLV